MVSSFNKKKILIYSLIFIAILILINLNISNAAGGMKTSDVNDIVEDIKFWYGFGTVACTVVALGAFIFNIVRLGASSTNAQARQMAIRGIMISGIVGALAPVSGIFYFLILNFMQIK